MTLRADLKKKLVGTMPGRALLAAGHWKALRTIGFANPEAAATIANDILADRLIARLCPAGGTFVDIGAHIGSILSSVHAQVPDAKIIAFEADPSKIAHLKAKYPFCELFDMALGEKAGMAEFQINPEATGYNSLVVDDASAAQSISVQVARLDDILKGRTIDVIKMDVEGAELGVLIGGAEVIAAAAPTIMFESVGLAENGLGYSPKKLWEWLNAHDYQVFAPNRLAHDAHPLTCDAFLDGHQYPFYTHNYFAVARTRREAVRDKARSILNIRV